MPRKSQSETLPLSELGRALVLVVLERWLTSRAAVIRSSVSGLVFTRVLLLLSSRVERRYLIAENEKWKKGKIIFRQSWS